MPDAIIHGPIKMEYSDYELLENKKKTPTKNTNIVWKFDALKMYHTMVMKNYLDFNKQIKHLPQQ